MTDETQQGQNGGNGVAPKQIGFYYNALSQFTSIARYDFVGVGPMVDIATAAISYDGANRLTNLAYTGDGGQISIDSFAFTLDNADRITARTSSVDGTVNFGYDVTNQVTGATYTGGSGEPANESYTYSKNGNRTNTGYSTGTNNQLLSDGTFNYQYDGEGNRTVRTRISNSYDTDYKTVYGWDYRDRLTDVSYYDNNGVLTKHVHYVYDSFDHEIGKQVDDTGGGSYDRAEWYVLDVSPEAPQANVPSTNLADPLFEFDQNGNLLYRFLNGPTPAGVDAVLGEEAITTQGQAGTDYWPLGDQVNTPHEVVNNASTTVDHLITNTFGVVTSESNTSIHHWAGFEGGHFDPDTALTNDDHRWYDPVVGRWISEDPIGFGGGDANIVCYVGNNPVRNLDAHGEAPPPDWNNTPINGGSQSAHSSGTPVNPNGPAAQFGQLVDSFTPINTGSLGKHPSTPLMDFLNGNGIAANFANNQNTPINLGSYQTYKNSTPINLGKLGLGETHELGHFESNWIPGVSGAGADVDLIGKWKALIEAESPPDTGKIKYLETFWIKYQKPVGGPIKTPWQQYLDYKYGNGQGPKQE